MSAIFAIKPNTPPGIKKITVFDLLKFGGDEEDRTLDLTDANRTLSQLSYAPKRFSEVRRLYYCILSVLSSLFADFLKKSLCAHETAKLLLIS